MEWLTSLKPPRACTTAHNAIRDVLSKPDQYIAVDVTCSKNLQFGGTKAPAAMVCLAHCCSNDGRRLSLV